MNTFPRPPAGRFAAPINSVGWRGDAASKKFVEAVTQWCLVNQSSRCAYCAVGIGDAHKRSVHLDHLVSKGKKRGYPQFTHEVLNLLAACEHCNTKLKTEKPTIKPPPNAIYEANVFLIVHPYLDDWRKHFRGGYRGGASFPRPLRGRTPEARRMIEMFRLDTSAMLTIWRWEATRASVEAIRATLDAPVLQRMQGVLNEMRSTRRR